MLLAVFLCLFLSVLSTEAGGYARPRPRPGGDNPNDNFADGTTIVHSIRPLQFAASQPIQIFTAAAAPAPTFLKAPVLATSATGDQFIVNKPVLASGPVLAASTPVFQTAQSQIVYRAPFVAASAAPAPVIYRGPVLASTSTSPTGVFLRAPLVAAPAPAASVVYRSQLVAAPAAPVVYKTPLVSATSPALVKTPVQFVQPDGSILTPQFIAAPATFALS